MAADSGVFAYAHPRFWPTWLGLALMRALSLLPAPLVWAIGSALGELLYWLHAPRRHVVQVNLRLCFPELPERRRRRLARAHVRAFVQAALLTTIGWWGSERRLARLGRCVGCEHLDRLLAAGRRVILLVPHFVAVEIGGLYLALERDMIDMYKRPKNKLFLAAMLKGLGRFGDLLVERGEGLRPVIRRMKQGGTFYYLPDQDPGRTGSVFAPFFGVPTATLSALGRLATVTDATVLPCSTHLLPWGRGFEIIIEPPLENFPSGDELADTTRMNAIIEAAVRRAPAQYLWVHKRFKTRPQGDPSPYAR